jgi:hypothetical protein
MVRPTWGDLCIFAHMYVYTCTYAPIHTYFMCCACVYCVYMRSAYRRIDSSQTSVNAHIYIHIRMYIQIYHTYALQCIHARALSGRTAISYARLACEYTTHIHCIVYIHTVLYTYQGIMRGDGPGAAHTVGKISRNREFRLAASLCVCACVRAGMYICR